MSAVVMCRESYVHRVWGWGAGGPRAGMDLAWFAPISSRLGVPGSYGLVVRAGRVHSPNSMVQPPYILLDNCMLSIYMYLSTSNKKKP